MPKHLDELCINTLRFLSVDMVQQASGGWSYEGRNLHFGVREHAM